MKGGIVINKGVINEYNFANIIKNKKYGELDDSFKQLINALYPNITSNDYIGCWVSNHNEKSDIKICVNGIIKGVSIKMGHHNSVHAEHLDDFCSYMTKIGVDENIVYFLQDYANFKTSVNVDFDEKRMQKIQLINEAFNDFYVKLNMYIRFLFQGADHFPFSAHIMIYGTPQNFMWATRNEIMDFLLKDNYISKGLISIGPFSLQIYFKNNKKFIQIKWHTLEYVFRSIHYQRLKNKMPL